jgi:hypothetical protein
LKKLVERRMVKVSDFCPSAPLGASNEVAEETSLEEEGRGMGSQVKMRMPHSRFFVDILIQKMRQLTGRDKFHLIQEASEISSS